MKRFLILVALLQQVCVYGQRNNSFTVTQDRNDATLVDVQIGEYSTSTVQTSRGQAQVIRIPNGNSILVKGAPDLPSLSSSIIIPTNHEANLTIESANFKEYQKIEVAPSKGKIYRNQDPSNIPFTYSDVYYENAFFPTTIANLQNPHTLRDFEGQTIKIHPVQYNPVTKTLRVYHNLKLKISYALKQGAVSQAKPNKVDETYDLLYKNHFINYENRKLRYSPIKEFGSMLVVSPGGFLDAMQPYINWKRRVGIQVYVCNTDTLSGGVNENTVKGIAKWYYQNKQIAYMLLVGDHQQIPAANSLVTYVQNTFGPCSDWVHAYVSNNDHYPEFLVGRFSAENVQDVVTQVSRTVNYEINPNVSSNWYSKQIGIASSQGDSTSDDAQRDFEHICNILDSNKNQYVYVNNPGYFDDTQTICGDAAGYPTASEIVSAFNSGLGLINYCGHGSVQAFSTSGFSNSQVSSITNTSALPFVFSTACNNGEFMNNTCLAEALIRARDGSNTPTGAVATLMCSILQTWDPPMEGQDEMNAILRGARSNNIRTTYGAMVGSGLMALMDKYNTFADPDGGNEVADTWVLFGDPSLTVKTKHEGTITCSYSGFIQQGEIMMYVQCPVEGARVSLLYKNDVIASNLVQGGMVVLYFSPLMDLDSISVTATKQNWIPHLGKVDVVNYPLSINSLAKENIFIYPNPTQDFVTVQVNNTEYADLELLDNLGRVIHRQAITDNKINLSLIPYAKGSYVLRLSGKGSRSTSKLVKY